MRILLAVDGSPCSDAAVEEVARRPWPEPGEIRLVSVVEPPSLLAMPDTWGPPSDFYEKLQRPLEERAAAAIDSGRRRLRERLAGARLEVSSLVLHGPPREEILAEAERWNADLIVLGSHGYQGLKRLWLGSVSLAVATHAGCSVEIVRSRAD